MKNNPINDILRLDTYREDKIILQKITFFWLISIGAMYSIYDGEHYTFLVEFGPIQMDWTFRFWKI